MNSDSIQSSPLCIECYAYGAVTSGIILIQGLPGSGKTTLLKALMRIAVQNGKSVLYLSTQSNPAQIRELATQWGATLGQLDVIDCFAISEGPEKARLVRQKMDLSKVSDELSRRLIKVDSPYVVFDSLDHFVMDAGEDDALKFCVGCCRALTLRSVAGCATVTSGIHSEVFESRIRAFFQGVIEVKLLDSGGKFERLMRIKHLRGASHPTDWYQFEITGEGILIGTVEYRSKLPPRHAEPHFFSFNAGARGLAAIMFTDIIGYTALAQRNESHALELLEEHRSLIRKVIPEYHGAEIKTFGDAFLVEFASALEATLCAVELQRVLHQRNLKVGRENKIELRIGIHVGDVEHREGDVLGDAVNIASRIYPIAEHGGICITRQVLDQVWNKTDYQITKIGDRELKNIRQPLEVFRINLPWASSARESVA